MAPFSPRPLLPLVSALALALAGCSTEPSYVSTGAGGASGTASTGATGTECTVPADCPGKENECSARTCEAGKWGGGPAPPGGRGPAPGGGARPHGLGGGPGAAAPPPDDADVPSDGNACTLDVCSGGVPSHPSAPAGTACGIGLACNESGQCAGCTDAAQCGVPSACTSYQCSTDQICVFDYVAAGQGDPGGQQAGDCFRLTCNGMGGTSTVPDDTDVPVDGNPCTLDLCAMGSAQNPPAPATTPCGGNFTCDGAGSCEGCSQSSDCGQDSACASYVCTAGACQATYVPAGQGDPGGQQAGDCQKKACNGAGAIAVLADDTDAPNDGNACTQDLCAGGVPSNPPAPANTPCGGNLHCNGAGVCTGCTQNADCGAPSACATPTCNGGTCVTELVPFGLGDPGGQAGGDCKKNVCDGSGSAVAIADDGDVPNDGNDCTSDVCSGGNPSNPPKPAGSGCGGGVCDGAGSCVGCTQNADCGSASACATPVCNGGSCGVSYVPAGQGDPGGQTSGDCKHVACNGSGGTAQYNDDGDVPNDGNGCTSDSCSGGVPVHQPIPPQDDNNPCTTDVCNPGTGQTDHIPVANGTSCGACATCQSGGCAYACNGCQECYQDVCYAMCFQADCLKCNLSQTGCVSIPNCIPQ